MLARGYSRTAAECCELGCTTPRSPTGTTTGPTASRSPTDRCRHRRVVDTRQFRRAADGAAGHRPPATGSRQHAGRQRTRPEIPKVLKAWDFRRTICFELALSADRGTGRDHRRRRGGGGGEKRAGPDFVVTLSRMLSRSRSGDVTVSYATSDGTAQSGLDYSETSGSVTVPGGSTTATVGVEILDDVTMKGRRPSR